MGLPNDFRAVEHLLDLVRKIHNAWVRDEFDDVKDLDDITVPRSSLKIACLISDNDSALIVILRIIIFFFHLRKARDLMPIYYAIPLDEIHATRRFVPQITFYWLEPEDEIEYGYRPIEGTFSFRLMGETSETITLAKLRTIATAIQREFMTGTKFVWKRGKQLYYYGEKDKGYQLQMLSRDEENVKELIRRVLAIQGHTPDWENLSIGKSGDENRKYPQTPRTIRVLGKSRKEPRKRPNVNLLFSRAVADAWAFEKPITLVQANLVDLTTLIDT
ncbi:hypothetical protein V0288_04600 [Pannus brasiliensis CCIBt3594]|uniref:Uncharacterized protein n=1 Tax=Pannus brasiliensis CCIBt3594 TaxID=1427578 RepID=A0AAW9QNS4_9CHRO